MPDETLSETVPEVLPKRRLQRDYGDDERANVFLQLRLNGGNVEKTARETGVPPATIRTWRGQGCHAGRRAEALADQRSPVAAAEFRVASGTFLRDALAEREAMSPYQKVLASGITLDKALLLEGSPTSIVGHVSTPLDRYTPEQLDAIRVLMATPINVMDALALPAPVEPDVHCNGDENHTRDR